jgi:hypothetical protein
MTEQQNTEELDLYLQELVHALHQTVSHAVTHLSDEKETEKALHDCDKILAVVLEGRVGDWLA